MDAYPHRKGIDAYLDIYFENDNAENSSGAGYLGKGAPRDYYAYLHIAARLVDADSGKVLYARQTIYNPRRLPIGTTLIKPGLHFGFSGYKDLMAHIKRVIAGFQVAVGKVAQSTAS